MTNILTIEELKNSVLNANIDDEYVQPALTEAQDIYLREILGDALLNAVITKIETETLSGRYLTLVNQYIKPYLTYMVQSLIAVPINYKIRNAGVIQQYDQGYSASTMKDTQYLKNYYDEKAEFYGNRLTEYLMKNSSYIVEYRVMAENITQPTTSQNVTNIYLGGIGSKKTCGTKSGGGGGTGGSVEWDDILNKPQPTIGAGIITIEQGDVTQSFNVNDTENKTIHISDGVVDYNDLQNKPDLSVYAEKADTYTKNEIDATTSQINQQIGTKADQSSLDTHTGNSTIHVTAEDKTNWNGKANAADVYTKTEIDGKETTINNSIATKANQTDLTTHTGNSTIHVTATDKENWNGKTTMAAVEAKGYAVANDLATVATSGSYSDLSNTPNLATVATSGSYGDLSNTPNLATVATSGNYSDLNGTPNLATVATSGSYTDLNNTPSIPDDETDIGLTTETWTFALLDDTVVTKQVVIKPTA